MNFIKKLFIVFILITNTSYQSYTMQGAADKANKTFKENLPLFVLPPGTLTIATIIQAVNSNSTPAPVNVIFCALLWAHTAAWLNTRILDVENTVEKTILRFALLINHTSEELLEHLNKMAYSGNVGGTKLLLDHGTLLHPVSKGHTPLHSAVKHTPECLGHVIFNKKLVKLLLKHGASTYIHTQNNEGETPLELAAQYQEPGIFELLIAYDDSDKWKQCTPDITNHVKEHHETIKKLILKRYHNPRMQWNYAYHAAKRMSNNTLPAVLAEKIADLKVPDFKICAPRLAQRLGISHKKHFAEFYPKQPSKKPSLADVLDDVPNCTIC